MKQWDTAGQERYRTITNAYYKGSDGIIVVFDLCNKVIFFFSNYQESFVSVTSWMKEIDKHAGDTVTIQVLANKADCAKEDREVTDDDIQKFEKDSGLKVLRVSAKTAENVDESFLELTKRLMLKRNSSSQEDQKKQLMLKKLKEEDQVKKEKSSNQCCFKY